MGMHIVYAWSDKGRIQVNCHRTIPCELFRTLARKDWPMRLTLLLRFLQASQATRAMCLRLGMLHIRAHSQRSSRHMENLCACGDPRREGKEGNVLWE